MKAACALHLSIADAISWLRLPTIKCYHLLMVDCDDVIGVLLVQEDESFLRYTQGGEELLVWSYVSGLHPFSRAEPPASTSVGNGVN